MQYLFIEVLGSGFGRINRGASGSWVVTFFLLNLRMLSWFSWLEGLVEKFHDHLCTGAGGESGVGGRAVVEDGGVGGRQGVPHRTHPFSLSKLIVALWEFDLGFVSISYWKKKEKKRGTMMSTSPEGCICRPFVLSLTRGGSLFL